METKTIICYWHLSKYPDLKFQHQSVYDFTTRKRNRVVNQILDKGYNVMISRTNMDTFIRYIIWIDKGRFQQS